MKRKILSILMLVLLMLIFTGCSREIPVEEETSAEVTDNNTADTATPTNGAATGDSAVGATEEPTAAPAEMVPEDGAELTFWTGDADFGEAVAANFEAKYGVPVTVEEVGLGAISKIKLDGPAGSGPDVFMSPHDSFQEGLDSGAFLELDERIVANLKERIVEVGMETVTSNGKVYGVPVSLETTCMFYNKDIVGDQPAATLEEIIQKAPEFNDPKNNKFYFLIKVSDGYKIYPILSANGFQVFGPDGTDQDNPGFDTDEFEKGLELVGSLRDIMPMNSTDLGNVSILANEFTEGKVAYEFSGPWDIKTFKESGVNFGVTVLPTYNGKQLTPFAGVQNAHVSAYTEYPIAAQLFAEYLVSNESAGLMYEKADKITTLKDVSQIEGLSEDENSKPFIQQFENSVPMPSISRISFFWTISASTCQSVFDEKLTPAEGRQKAIDDWNTFLTTEK